MDSKYGKNVGRQQKAKGDWRQKLTSRNGDWQERRLSLEGQETGWERQYPLQRPHRSRVAENLGTMLVVILLKAKPSPILNEIRE